MIGAGIWAHPADRWLTVVVVRPDGTRRPPMRVARTEAARAGLAHYLAALGDVHLAVTDSIAQRDPIAHLVRDHSLTGWLVPDALLDSISAAAGLGPYAARSRAAVLARLPSVSGFRNVLRRVPAPDPRQLTLVP